MYGELSHHIYTYTHVKGKKVISSLSQERGALRDKLEITQA